MFGYNVTYKPSFNIDEKTIDDIINYISNIVKKGQEGIVNIVFLDEDSIKNLNKKYRNIDKVTDVLSFHYFDDFSLLKKDDIAGEVILCEQKIISQGREFQLGTEKEFYKLLIHSLLHLLGYDHEQENDYKIMGELEKKIWVEVFEK